MLLTKRYFDVIDDTGGYLIAYDAVAHIGRIPLRYRATLSDQPGLRRARVGVSGALTAADTFPCSLGITGAPIECGRRQRLNGVQVTSGPISWRVDAIGFPAKAGAISGLGYCETVSLAVAPWSLGLRGVRWGRFVGACHWAVWNLTTGANPIDFAALNGVPANVAAHANRIDLGAARIDLGAVVRTVADGDVIATELGVLRPVIALLAGSRFRLIQRKSVREARLIVDTGETELGLAMDETVEVST